MTPDFPTSFTIDNRRKSLIPANEIRFANALSPRRERATRIAAPH
jgi:hypothetical protein